MSDTTIESQVQSLTRVLDPVVFDLRATARNLGQEWNRTSGQMLAHQHAARAVAAAMCRP